MKGTALPSQSEEWGFRAGFGETKHSDIKEVIIVSAKYSNGSRCYYPDIVTLKFPNNVTVEYKHRD